MIITYGCEYSLNIIMDKTFVENVDTMKCDIGLSLTNKLV